MRYLQKPMLESQVQKPVIDYARKKYGLLCVKREQRSSSGMPDFDIFITGGKLLMMEFKAPGNLPTPKQAGRHKILIDLGYEVHVCDNKEYGKSVIDFAMERTRSSATALETGPKQKSSRKVSGKPRLRSSVGRSRVR